MTARNLEIKPLLDKDVPSFAQDYSLGLLLYRDTLNYLEYLKQVFSKLAQTTLVWIHPSGLRLTL